MLLLHRHSPNPTPPSLQQRFCAKSNMGLSLPAGIVLVIFVLLLGGLPLTWIASKATEEANGAAAEHSPDSFTLQSKWFAEDVECQERHHLFTSSWNERRQIII
jgi:hypothetical protein